MVRQSFFNRIINIILDIITPPKCVICFTKVIKTNTLCIGCWSKLTFISKPKCAICSNTFPVTGLDSVCFDCKEMSPFFHKVISSVVYNETTEQIIFGLKYQEKIYLAEIISEFICNALTLENCKIDLLIPVPLHASKLKNRGFNQAALIAKKVAKKLSIPITYDVLIKPKNNESQSKFAREMRFKNVKNVFAVSKTMANLIHKKNVCIIDDVITTGATVNECAKVLRRAGASKVFAASFARTVK